MTFFASHIIFYLLVGIQMIIVENKDLSFVESVKYNIENQKSYLIIILIAVVISIAWLSSMKKWKNNTRYYKKIEKASNYDVVLNISSYAAYFFIAVLTSYGFVVLLIILIAFGYFTIIDDRINYNIGFNLIGYKIYKSQNNFIITKKKKEEFNIYIDENENGIQAKQISPNVFLICE